MTFEKFYRGYKLFLSGCFHPLSVRFPLQNYKYFSLTAHPYFQITPFLKILVVKNFNHAFYPQNISRLIRKNGNIHGNLMSTYKFEKIIFVFSNLICTYMKGSTNTGFVLIQFCSTNEKLVNSLIQSMKFNYFQLMKYYKNALIIATQQFNVIIATVTIISIY